MFIDWSIKVCENEVQATMVAKCTPLSVDENLWKDGVKLNIHITAKPREVSKVKMRYKIDLMVRFMPKCYHRLKDMGYELGDYI